MNSPLTRLSPRTRLIGVSLLLATAVTVACLLLIGPSVTQLQVLRSDVRNQAGKYRDLELNLKKAEGLDADSLQRAMEAVQTENNEAALSTFLRRLEGAARYPSLRIVNIRPSEVEEKDSFLRYSARVTVAGRLDEVVQCVADLTAKGDIGVESFTLRAKQRAGDVEAILLLSSVRTRESRSPRLPT